METFKLRGKTLDECKQRMRLLYGERAVCFQQSPVRSGGIFGLFTREEVEITGYIPIPPPVAVPSLAAAASSAPADLEKEKQKLLGTAAQITKTDPKMLEILKELKNLGSKIDETHKNTQEATHKNIERIVEIMEMNDFLPSYRKKIIERMKKELPLDVIDDFYELQQQVLEWIGETIGIYEENDAPAQRLIVLVGPTGVGKTTTIAKLGVAYILGKIGKMDGIGQNVSLVTIDRYRTGAPEQLRSWADAMNAPFQVAADADSLKRAITLESNDNIILIDTIGRSPNDVVEIAHMQKLLSVCGPRAEYYLVVDASKKAADLIDIINHFEPFASKSVIVTKLDETSRAGNVISALFEKSKRVSYITYGQEHDNLFQATVLRFLTTLEGFEVNRERLERRFNP